MRLTVNALNLFLFSFAAFTLMPVAVRSFERGSAEFGVDGVVSVTNFNGPSGFFGSGPRDITEISFPSRVRFGTFTSEKIELDVMINFVSIHQGNSDASSLALKVGIGIHPSNKLVGSVGFIEPIAGVNFVNSRSMTEAQFVVGAEAGIKIISRNGLATRLSGSVSHSFETNSFLGANTFGINFGISFFTNRHRR